MRATLSADRSREHHEAHTTGDTVVHNRLRAEEVAHWATIGGAKALGLDGVTGSLVEGKKADIVLLKNDESPAMYPLLHPYGSLVFQAGRGDVHTVLVNGEVLKHAHRLQPGPAATLASAKQEVARTVDYARGTMGEDAWRESLTPEIPTTERIRNPYTYTDFDGGDAQHRAQTED